MDNDMDVFVHLKILEGRNFSSTCSKLELDVRFMGWKWKEISSSDGSRPKWTLNTSLPPVPVQKFISRVKDNHIIIQILNLDFGHGLVQLPLDPFYSALETGQERLLVDNFIYPIIGYNGWIDVIDVISMGDEIGQLNIQLAAGSQGQMENFTKFYGYDEQNFPASIKPPLQAPKESKSTEEEAAQSDFSINVSVIEGRNLPYLKDRQNPNPNSYVSFENKFYSSVIHNSRDPIWNFTVKGLPLDNEKRYLIVRVWHSNLNTSDEVLGFAAIDLFANGDTFEEVTGWHNVIDFTGRLKGQIKVEISSYKEDPLVSPPSLMEKTEAFQVFTNNFSLNLKILEELSNNLKARLNLKDDLNQVCSLDFDSLRLKETHFEMPDLGNIDWSEVLENGEDTRRTADGQSIGNDAEKDS